ncbi:hypothetical protein ACNUDN_16145 [Mycobacterium sp. smrl_JER01]|uniref:DUF7162 family protein n=1 Tax=Mycobacterium sp. smrl_JER01 TaxID=3402633 RepID=UPI003AC3A93D
MGEIAHVDVDRLHALAGRFESIAGDVAALDRAGVDPGALPGSAVSATPVAELIGTQIQAVVGGLTGWAAAARASAEMFRQTDTVNGERFPLR